MPCKIFVINGLNMFIFLFIPAVSACIVHTQNTTSNFELPPKLSKHIPPIKSMSDYVNVNTTLKHKMLKQLNTCESCENKSCPQDIIPSYGPVTNPSSRTMQRLNDAILFNFEQEKITPDDLALRVAMMDDIRNVLLATFPHVNLTLFGSAVNGMGLRSNTDVDMCITSLHNDDKPSDSTDKQMIDGNLILEKALEALTQSGKVKDVAFIPARTSIVQFRHISSHLDGDLSFCVYTKFSIQKAMWLKQYADMDIRVGQLGLFLKKLVKPCRIAEANSSGLASIAWVYMLIYFLQQHNVPVVPAIQESAAWDGHGKNQDNVAELWLSFLNFYVEKFDHEKFVVSVAQSKLLLQSRKSWYTNGIAIEDPIVITDNKGVNLTRKISVYIFKTLENLRQFFHRSTDLLSNHIDFLHYYLDERNVRIGNPPTNSDRQCRPRTIDGYSFTNNLTQTHRFVKLKL